MVSNSLCQESNKGKCTQNWTVEITCEVDRAKMITDLGNNLPLVNGGYRFDSAGSTCIKQHK